MIEPPPLSEISDTTLRVFGVGAVVVFLYIGWDFMVAGGSLVRAMVGWLTGAAVAVAGPVRLGWPADSSYVAGGVVCAVVIVGGRLLGWR